MVDDTLVSCYSHVRYHWLGHAALFPLRSGLWLGQKLGQALGVHRWASVGVPLQQQLVEVQSGVHWYAHIHTHTHAHKSKHAQQPKKTKKNELSNERAHPQAKQQTGF